MAQSNGVASGGVRTGSKWNAGKLEFFDRNTGDLIAVFDPTVPGLTIPSGSTLDVSAGTVSGALGVGSVTKLNLAAATAETYGSTVSIDVTKTHHRIAGANGTSATSTFNASASGSDGDVLDIEVASDSGGTCTITFGTNFKSSGTLAVTASHFASVRFISDGMNWKEHSRSAIIAS